MPRKIVCLVFLLMVAIASLPWRAHAQTATESVLYSFCGSATCPQEGDVPINISGLIQAADGNFYATKGPTVYKVTPSGTVTTIPVTTMYAGQLAPGLVQASDGNFYGSVQNAPNNSIFQLTPAGTVTTINGDFGASAPLTQGADGKLYGIWGPGGGEFFSTTLAGNYTPLYAFCATQDPPFSCNTPANALGNPLQGADGNFYGVTTAGGSGDCTGGNTCPLIYDLTPSGSLYSSYNFEYLTPPVAQQLVEGPDGFYGSTGFGSGTNALDGAIFEAGPLGADLIYYFCHGGQSQQCPDGVVPSGSLVFGPDGSLYGATSGGGANDLGTIFKLAPTTATLTTLYNFCSLANCADGSTPVGSLIIGGDGNIYGTTSAGGANNGGVIFKLALTPALSPAVQLSLSSSTVEPGSPVTLSWSVPNAYSITSQQCYAFVQNGATTAGTWTGLETGTLTNGIYSGSASITPSAAGAYTYALTCAGTQSGFATLQVGGAKSPSTTTLTANSPVVLGGLVTLSAAVSTTQSVGPITGTVAFSYGTLALGTVNVTNNTASLNVTAQGIPTGTYQVKASYSGDSNYSPSSGTTSVTVLGYATSTTLSASSGQVTQGQSVTLSADVVRTSASGTPSGNVTFSYGSRVLGTANLVSGKAAFTASTSGSIPPGSYAVTAKYDGDAADQASTSSPVNVTVIAKTETDLTVSPNPVPKNSAVTLTAKVKQAYGSAIPTGSVTFSVGSYVVGKEPLDNTGTAVVNASDVGIAPGAYPVTATYSGDASNAVSSSSAVSVVVQ